MKGGITKEVKQERMDMVAKYDRRGYSVNEIAKQLNLTQQQVYLSLAAIRKEYQKYIPFEEKFERIREKLQQLKDIREEAWLAWERSKQDCEKFMEEKGLRNVKAKPPTQSGDDEVDEVLNGMQKMNPAQLKEQKLGIVRQIRQIQGRLPVNDYLVTIARCLDQECKLEGLYELPTVNINVDASKTTVNVGWWEQLHRPIQNIIEVDPIEAKIKAVEQGSPNGVQSQVPPQAPGQEAV